jgi:hypothetical protein
MSDQQLLAATEFGEPTLMRALRSLNEDGCIDAVLVQPDQSIIPFEPWCTFGAQGPSASWSLAR